MTAPQPTSENQKPEQYSDIAKQNILSQQWSTRSGKTFILQKAHNKHNAWHNSIAQRAAQHNDNMPTTKEALKDPIVMHGWKQLNSNWIQ